MQPTDPAAPTPPEWAMDAPADDVRSHSLVTTRAVVMIVGACVILYLARAIFLPLTMSMLFAFVLTPVVNFLCRRGLPSLLAVMLTVLAAGTLVAAFLLVLAVQLGQIGANLPQYQGNVLGKIDALLTAGSDSRILTHLQFMFENISNRLGTLSAPAGDAPGAAPKVEVVEQTSLKDWFTGLILPMLKPIGAFGLIFVLVTFALLERDALRDRLVQLIGGANILATSQMLAEAGARVSTYLLAQVVVNVIYALPIWLGLWLIGVPNALFFGLVTLVARFLPYVGSAVSALLPLLMAFAVSPDWSLVLWTAGLFGVVEFVTSNVVEPWFYGQRTGLSPLAVIVSAMFWTWLWGPLGLFLATPLTVCLVVVGHHVPVLRLFPIVLGDKPVLDEPARLYDRLLAGRADAPAELAAALVGQGHLDDYFNQTLIPALMLADADHDAGLLSDLQVARIAHAARGLIHDLDAMAEDDPTPPAPTPAAPLPPAWNDLPAPVLIRGAKTRLDDVAAHLLARTLTAAGMACTVQRGAAKPVAKASPGTIVITALGSGHQRLLRLQLRQLRRQFPKAQVIVALWPGSDTAVAEGLAPSDYRVVGAAPANPPRETAP